MSFLRIAFFILFLLLFFDKAPLQCEDVFPKIGFVKNEGSNIRSGNDTKSDILCKLRKGDPVKIIKRYYNWFRIELPSMAYVYISADFLEPNSEDNAGSVVGSNVNLRAGPSLKHLILGQVSEPETLNIVSKDDSGWYKIEPPKGKALGWIHNSQIRFDIDMEKAIQGSEKPVIRLLKEK